MSDQTASRDVTVRSFEDILDKQTRKVWHEAPLKPAISYCPEELLGKDHLRIIHNGSLLTEEEASATRVLPGDELIFYILPADPASLSFLIYVGVASAIGTGAGASYGFYAMSRALTPAIGLVEQKIEDSAVYGWDATINTVRPGTIIPIVYGTHRVGGHIIQQFERESRIDPVNPTDPKAGELHTLIGICSGPIESVSDVWVDKNPISDFGLNVSWEFRTGQINQASLDGFQDVVEQFPQQIELKFVDPPVTMATQNPVDAFEIIFQFPGGLYKVGTGGHFRNSMVEFRIEYRVSGTTSWLEAGTISVEQDTPNPFNAWFRSQPLERAIYEIRVTRRTADMGDKATGYSNSSIIALNEVTQNSLSYPGIALLAIRQLPTNQVSGNPPQYSSLVKGRRVKVYSNLTTYSIQWSDNPAWCLLDFLTDPIFGLGAWIDTSRICLQDFIDWGSWCDELVPIDEQGGTENRYRLNMVLDGSMTAMSAIKQMCLTGGANFLLRGNKWGIQIERISDPVQFFQMSRILKDSLSVTKLAQSVLPNTFVGEYWDEDLDYEQNQLPKEDSTILTGDEQRELSINLLGSTKTSQVNRLLNMLILDNRLSRRMIEFEVGTEACALEAGDVFKVAHDVPGWGTSGQIREVLNSGTDVLLDREVTIEAGKIYELTLIQPSNDIETVIVTSLPGVTNLLSTSGDWHHGTPPIGAPYSFGEVLSSTVSYRCVGVSRASPLTSKIRARQYDPAIYGTDLTVLPAPSPSRLIDPGRIPPDVRDLRLQERQVFEQDGTLSTAIDVHFTLPAVSGALAQVYWRELGDILWMPIGEPVTVGYVSITENISSPGYTYEVSVVPVSANGNRKAPEYGLQATITTAGVTRQPGVVLNFTCDRTFNGLIFRWDPLDPVINFDLAYYEIRDGMQWDTALLVGRTSGTLLETGLAVESELAYYGTRRFWIRAFNTSGKSSPTSSMIAVEVTERIGANTILMIDEGSTYWTGVKENFEVDGTWLVLQTTSSVVAWRSGIQTAPFHSSIIPGGYGIGFHVTGCYVSEKHQVATTAIRCIVTTSIDIDQVDTSLYWNAAQLADKTWDSEFARTRAWGVAPDGRVKTKVEYRFSWTDSAEGSFGPWQERPVSFEVLVAWYQVRVTAEVLDPAWTVTIKTLATSFDAPDVTDSGSVETSASATVQVDFAKTFQRVPEITGICQPATAADDIFIDGVTTAHFHLEVKNGGSRVVRTVKWIAHGY